MLFNNLIMHSQTWIHITVISLFIYLFLIVMTGPNSSGMLVQLVWRVDWTQAILKIPPRASLVPPSLRTTALYYSAFETAAESCEMVEFKWTR